MAVVWLLQCCCTIFAEQRRLCVALGVVAALLSKSAVIVVRCLARVGIGTLTHVSLAHKADVIQKQSIGPTMSGNLYARERERQRGRVYQALCGLF